MPLWTDFMVCLSLNYILIAAGIRRGCVPIDVAKYGDVETITDTDSIQKIFDFTLEECIAMKATATFCNTSACNTENVTVVRGMWLFSWIGRDVDIKGGRMGRSDKVSLWCVSLLINTRFRFFILE